MNYKNIFKRETKVIAYVVICLALVVIGTSYALFLQVNNNTENQVVKAGSLEITYDKGNTVVVPGEDDGSCLIPRSDPSGGCTFTLSVRNTGSLPMQYNLLIYDNQAEALAEDPEAEFVDHKWIHHALTKEYTVAKKSDTVNEDKLLSNLDKYTEANKRILETAVIDAKETIEFTLKIWIDENAPTDIIGQYVYLKLDVVGTVYENATASQELLSTMGENGLAEIMPDETSTYQNANLKEYRYTGADPKNYIYFNCSNNTELSTCQKWRILGIYNVDNNGTTESRIKIVKALTDEAASWDQNGGTNYNTSSLHSYLNNDFYKESLSDTAKNQIDNATYKLGGANALNINGKALYASELASTESVSSKVGIMSLSDYVLASGVNGETTLENFTSSQNDNWLYSNTPEWMINKNAAGEVYALNAENRSIITTTNTGEEKLFRPTVYLASNIKIIGGDGTLANPYILSK